MLVFYGQNFVTHQLFKTRFTSDNTMLLAVFTWPWLRPSVTIVLRSWLRLLLLCSRSYLLSLGLEQQIPVFASQSGVVQRFLKIWAIFEVLGF
jgi:hypothetical protein